MTDEKYIADLERLTGVDLLAVPEVAGSYPEQDVVWFEPLTRLHVFIEAARGLLSPLL